MHDTSDRALLLRVRRGEAEAFGGIVRRYQAAVFNVCYRMLGERREAEDLAQEAFLRAYQRIETYDVDRPFGPWMRRLAVNLCLNHLRKRRAAQLPFDEEFDVPAVSRHTGFANPERARELGEQSEVVRSAILALPPHYRAVIELRHFQELSYQEISGALGIPLSDVKSHLYRARRRLAEMLSDHV